jgi:hypothetical protein
MSLGDIAAQLVHAAGETAKPLPISGTHAIVLSLKNEEQLFQTAEKLSARNIQFKIIYEPDAPYNGEATAIGLYPVKNRKQLRKVLSRLPLLTSKEDV